MLNMKKKIASILLAMFTVVSMMGGSIALMSTSAHAAASSGTIASAFKAYGDNGVSWGNSQFTINGNDGNSYDAVCAKTHANPPKPGKGVSFVRIDNGSELAKIAYWCYLHPGDTYSGHHAASYVHAGRTTNMHAKIDVSTIRSQAAGLSVPSGFEAYIGKISGSGWQDLLVWRNVPKGKLTLIKSVADNKALTDECKNMYSLAGAEYTVYNTSNTEVGKLVTKADGSTNELELLAGAYTVKETKAPKGYALDSQTYTVNVTAGGTATVESKDSPLFDPISIVLQKIAAGKSYLNTDADMSGAEFEVSYYDEMLDDVTGKTPTRTWVLKVAKAKNGMFYSRLRENFKLEGSDEFFKNESGTIIIPRGTVIIKELKAPKGFKLDKNIYIKHVDRDNEDNSMVYNFGATPEQPNKPLVPSIGTTAKDINTGDNVGSLAKKVKFVDIVAYKELSEGEAYTVKGKLMDKETGKALLIDGKEVTSEKTFKVTKDNSTIDENGASGTVELEFNVDSTVLSGKTTVVFEKLFYENKEIAAHADINDEGQSIHNPKIKTTAKSKETGVKQGMPREAETIVDTVKYDNLIVGKEYTVKGKLMDKETNKPLKDKDDNDIISEKTFTATSSSGTVDLEFTYNSLDRQGKTTVVFEDMYHNNIKVAVHADINDEGQSIDYPDIKTSADVKNTGKLKDGKVTILDKVSYTNLTTGKEYTVKGKLMDKATGKPFLVDGKEITAEKTFKAKNINGTVNIEFILPAKAMEGKTTVVFEDMFNEGVKIATHSDLTDKNQTVSIGVLDVFKNGLGGYPLTGDASKLMYGVAALVCAALALGGIFFIKKKNTEKKDASEKDGTN